MRQYAKNHLQFFDFRYDKYSSKRCGKRAKNDNFRTFCYATPPVFIVSSCGSFCMYTSLFGMINIQILNCHGIFGHLSVSFRPRKATISWAIKYLDIFLTKKIDVYKKICITMRRLTFRSPICDPMNNGGAAPQNVRFLAHLLQRFDEYLSHRKLEIGR